MRRIAVCAAVIALGLLPTVAAAAAGAAPTYVTSDPQNGASVSSAPSRVSVTFSEPLDSSSTLQVFDQCGRAVSAGDEQVLGSRIDVGVTSDTAGHYTAVYVAKGFGGATGETKGAFSFHVTSGPSCGAGHDHGGHGGHEGGSGGHEGGHGGGHEGGHGGGHEGNHESHGGHGGGTGHSGHASGVGHHTSGGHATHTSGSGHAGHSSTGHAGSHHDGSSHGAGHHAGGGHAGAHGSGTSGDGLPELASGRGGLGLAPTSTSVGIALTLSIAMGALGGWVLRVSAGS
jgi:methionine-rich copper-binding protein CopC